MINNPCYIIFNNIDVENSTITCICVDCYDKHKINGWYWDKGFFEDEEIKCSSCDSLIFKRENNEDKTTI